MVAEEDIRSGSGYFLDVVPQDFPTEVHVGWERNPEWLQSFWLKPLQWRSCYQLRWQTKRKFYVTQVTSFSSSGVLSGPLVTLWGMSSPLGILFKVLPTDTISCLHSFFSCSFCPSQTRPKDGPQAFTMWWLLMMFPFPEALPPHVPKRRLINPLVINSFQLTNTAFSDISWQKALASNSYHTYFIYIVVHCPFSSNRLKGLWR